MEAETTELLRTAFAAGASDLFLMEGQRPRVRQDGEVITAGGGPFGRQSIAALWRQCGLDPERMLDGDASLSVDGIGRVRVNAYRSLDRLAIALRPVKSTIPSFDELGLPGEMLARWLGRRSGLVLVTGPTGSGKSTTVAACLESINRSHRRHIVTIEDPIEYLFENDRCLFSQREVHHDTGGFDTALRQALRQNPDVIFFGEIRDADSALAALRASETGHLVISTLHGSGVSGVPASLERLGRMMGSGAEEIRSLLATQLVGILCQQLLPRIDGGLAPVLEYLENLPVTRKWIREGRFAELRDHLDESRHESAGTFLRHLVAAARRGVVASEVARAACERPQDFDRAMRGIS